MKFIILVIFLTSAVLAVKALPQGGNVPAVDPVPIQEAVPIVAPIDPAVVDSPPADDVRPPFEEVPVEDFPVLDSALPEDAPTADVPAEEYPVLIMPSPDVPVEDAPVEEYPVLIMPSPDTPVEDVPVEDSPVEEAVDEPILIAPAPQPRHRHYRRHHSRRCYPVPQAIVPLDDAPVETPVAQRVIR